MRISRHFRLVSLLMFFAISVYLISITVLQSRPPISRHPATIRSNSSYWGDLQQGATTAHASEQQPLQDGEPPWGSPQAYRGQLHIEVCGREDGALQLRAQLGSRGTIQEPPLGKRVNIVYRSGPQAQNSYRKERQASLQYPTTPSENE